MSQPNETPKTTRNESDSKAREKDMKHRSDKLLPEKGAYELFIFLTAIVTGTGCSIFAKMLYQLQGIGSNGELQYFDKPLFSTLSMFAAMLIGIPCHWVVVTYRIPFPGYKHPRRDLIEPKEDAIDVAMAIREEQARLVCEKEWQNGGYGSLIPSETSNISSTSMFSSENNISVPKALPVRTYFVLALLSLFDLGATALCAIGLLYLDVSVYQMLRGSGIIFVALLRQFGLKKRLFRFQWVGIFYNVLSVMLVGTAAILDATSTNSTASHDGETSEALKGVAFMLAGTYVQAMQFALEEKIMVHDEVTVPPLLLFGMEGVWGFLFSLFVLCPIGNALPGHDNGHYEDPFNAWAILRNTPSVQAVLALSMVSIFFYNLFAVLVTFSLSSVWHSILDNFRPMTVWVVDLCLYVSTHHVFGEAWTSNSWIELLGLVLLLYGTGIYNAPDVGSIQLKGQWFSLGFNFDQDYRDILRQRMFSMGSYPSIHRFLTGSIRESLRSQPQSLFDASGFSEILESPGLTLNV